MTVAVVCPECDFECDVEPTDWPPMYCPECGAWTRVEAEPERPTMTKSGSV